MSTSASAKLHIASQAHPLYACWAIPLKRRLANPYCTLVGQELLARYLRQCVVILWNGFHSIRHRKIVFLSNHTEDKPERRMTIRNNIRKR
jgi:hypothetical protein